jgi:hypothetical protein
VILSIGLYNPKYNPFFTLKNHSINIPVVQIAISECELLRIMNNLSIMEIDDDDGMSIEEEP